MSKLLTPQEALEALRAGKKVEYKPIGFDWTLLTPSRISISCLLGDDYQFRVRQEWVTIGDASFPKPESKPLKEGTEYWIAETSNQKYITTKPNRWEGDDLDNLYLHRCIIHLTEENAIAHAKALIKLSGGKVDE